MSPLMKRCDIKNGMSYADLRLTKAALKNMSLAALFFPLRFGGEANLVQFGTGQLVSIAPVGHICHLLLDAHSKLTRGFMTCVPSLGRRSTHIFYRGGNDQN